MSKKINKQDIIDTFNKKQLKVIDADKYKTAKTKLTAIDSEGYYYYVSTNSVLRQKFNIKSKVSKSNPYSLQNIKLWFKQNGYNDIDNIDIKLKWDKCPILVYKCPLCGDIVKRKWNKFLNFTSKNFYCAKCNKTKCAKEREYTVEQIEQKLSELDLQLLDKQYKGNTTSLLCEDKDGFRIMLKPTKIMNNRYKDINRYKYSNIHNSKNYIYNINNYFKINDIDCKALYYVEDNTYNDYPTLYCKCSCGEIFKTCYGNIKQNKFCSCPQCSHTESFLENKVKKWLVSKHIDFIQQYKFKDCKDKRELPFDFYLPKYNCCIEVDGQQHEEAVPFDGNIDKSLQRLKITKKHDDIKNKYCKDNNILLIRIPQNKIERRHEEYKEILYENLIKKK